MGKVETIFFQSQNWARCPNCEVSPSEIDNEILSLIARLTQVIDEHISGCNHMICRCGFHFCYKCRCPFYGLPQVYSQRAHSFHSAPTSKDGKCQRNPPCELWDETLLLDQMERARNGLDVAPPPPVAAPQAVNTLAEALAWMDNPREHLITVR